MEATSHTRLKRLIALSLPTASCCAIPGEPNNCCGVNPCRDAIADHAAFVGLGDDPRLLLARPAPSSREHFNPATRRRLTLGKILHVPKPRDSRRIAPIMEQR
jgi:hypothetical protein